MTSFHLPHYRHDITGLRAIAALAILIFHIDPRFSGGFIGVDIFFVISGYLITRNIWPALANKNFEFSSFYAKRFRRLFPAYASVLACSFIAIVFFGLNTEITHFGVSAISSLFYISNIYFYSVSDYFAPQMQLNPLLHTWSLSVEEQFYLVFPAFLLVCSKLKNKGVHLFLAVAAVSFLLSQLLLEHFPSASFYMSPSRFWQFMAGGILAIVHFKISSAIGAAIIAFSSYLILFLCFVFFTEQTVFPGFYALFPTIATMGLLLSGNTQNSLTWLLSNPLCRFFGNISYSLYLVHWPIIVFYKLLISPTLTASDKIILFGASVCLGYLNWLLVEQKCLKISLENRNKQTAWVAGCSMTVLSFPLILAAYTTFFHSKSQTNMDSWLNYDMQARAGQCFITSASLRKEEQFNETLCAPEEQDTSPKILLMGDSHAAQYYSALKKLLPSHDVHQYTATGCRPVYDIDNEEYCYQIMAKAYSRLQSDKQYDAVIIAGRWWDVDVPKIDRSLHAIKPYAANLFLIGPVPEYKQALPKLLSRFGEKSKTIDKVSKLSERRKIEDKLASLAKKHNVNYVSVIDAMCSNDQCIKTLGANEPIQFDYGHLTHNGAMYVLQKTLFAQQNQQKIKLQ